MPKNVPFDTTVTDVDSKSVGLFPNIYNLSTGKFQNIIRFQDITLYGASGVIPTTEKNFNYVVSTNNSKMTYKAALQEMTVNSVENAAFNAFKQKFVGENF